MNFYPFHIGDYAVHTRHLSLMEDLAYRRLLDLYYTHERPIPLDGAAREIGMREHEDDVAEVLRRFFVQTPDGWTHGRCDDEIARMRAKQDNARASAAKRSANAPQSQAPCERIASDQVAIATNTNTNTKKEKKPAAPSLTVEELKAEGLEEGTALEFLALRNRKGARLTRRAWTGIAAEIRKAGWSVETAILKALARGWVSFEADWVKDERTRKADAARSTVPARESADEARARLDADRMTPEQWESAKKARAMALASIKNITPKVTA